MSAVANFSHLDQKEFKKRRREAFWIVFLILCFLFFTLAEWNLSRLSRSLPFVNSIFFFGLLNLNMVVLGILIWLISRNIGKLLIERRRNMLGSQLKTKLVVAFFCFSTIPTLVLFTISALYIHSSFDKWFSVKVQNTLQASLDVTAVLYRHTEEMALHFSQHLAQEIPRHFEKKMSREAWLASFLHYQRQLLALDGVAFYRHQTGDHPVVVAWKEGLFEKQEKQWPTVPTKALSQAFSGTQSFALQHLGTGDFISCFVPVFSLLEKKKVLGVVAVSSYLPVSLQVKADEIATVLEDYRDTNPLKYPMKSVYFLLLLVMTLMVLFVAIWVGLYLAKELVNPLQTLMKGVQAVGAGHLNWVIPPAGQDEIAVLVDAFNQMTTDLRESRQRLLQSQREMAWREVARRIAHEIKNPLTPIQLSAQRLQRRLVDSGVYPMKETLLLKECTDIIIQHTRELKDLVNEFSQFARLPEISPALHVLHDVIEEALGLYKQAHGEIVFVFEKDERVPVFLFDRDQMKRVVINLLENATAAVLAREAKEVKKIKIHTHYHESVQLVQIGFQDSGLGMGQDILEHLFEPYFSTKQGGTGLGLTIVKRIVNDHEGFIRVKSVLGEGSQFLLELPTRRGDSRS